MRALFTVLSLSSSLLVAGCGASLADQPVALASQGTPQAFPLELAGEARVGWVIASHDASNITVSWVLNPGFELETVSLCARVGAFGWIDPALCERRLDGSKESTPTVVISFDSLGGAPACGEAIFLQAQAAVIGAGSAYAGTFKGRIALVSECAEAREVVGCSRNLASWIAQSEWPLETIEMASLAYSQNDMREILEMDAQSDASVLAARALVLARLNLAAGAKPVGAAEGALHDASAWLEKYGNESRVPFGMKVADESMPNAAGWDEGVNAAALLGRFNEGFAGSPRCEG